MNRRLSLMISVAALLLLAICLGVWITSNPQSGPRATLPDRNATDPMAAEMICIDQVLQDRNLEADQVDMRLAACKGGGSRSNAQ